MAIRYSRFLPSFACGALLSLATNAAAQDQVLFDFQDRITGLCS